MLRLTGPGNPVNIPDSKTSFSDLANLMTHRSGPVALDSSTGVRLFTSQVFDPSSAPERSLVLTMVSYEHHVMNRNAQGMA